METTDLRLDGTDPGALRPERTGQSQRDRAAERAQLKVLAQEFEALLLNEMLGDWRQSLAEGSDEDHGMGTMVDMVGSEFGRALSRAGGLGVAGQLLRAFDRRSAQPPDSPSAAPEPIHRRVTGDVVRDQAAAGSSGPAAVGGIARSLESEIRPVSGSVTSEFGMRRDPFSGRVKFHAGADIRMAYGTDVASVAGGQVSFAGERAGYGLTVVVDHPDGLQTRYAHLSSASVQAGDTVAAGQTVARSGNSGRSTGPHLHIELLRQGRPVDPSVLLKGVKGNADWKAYRSVMAESAQEPVRGDQE